MAMLVYRRVDTKNDALENISPFKHGVILGIYVCFQGCTFSQTDMAPENGSLEHYFPFGWEFAYFQGRTVSFRECILPTWGEKTH